MYDGISTLLAQHTGFQAKYSQMGVFFGKCPFSTRQQRHKTLKFISKWFLHLLE